MKWDEKLPTVEIWKEALRVAKPGCHLLAFGGTRTFHRLACNIEDAGWEFRDTIMWCYGSGFPKSQDVSKAIDKAAGVERKVVGKAADFARDGAKRKTDESHSKPHEEQGGHGYGDRWSADVTAPETEDAKTWHGWGSTLKPAWEPILVFRKPLIGTMAENVLKWGTGALNIDGCRVGTDGGCGGKDVSVPAVGVFAGNGGHIGGPKPSPRIDGLGRWPANLIHDGSDQVVSLFPESKSTGGSGEASMGALGKGVYGKYALNVKGAHIGGLGDSGSAARFFYCAKASKSDRGEGNNHPTVKPHGLMCFLCRLVTPPNGTVLDPFMGSGSTGKAAVKERFNFIGIDREAQYVEIARKRIDEAERKTYNPLPEKKESITKEQPLGIEFEE
jgi:site-specific DNA-methyltransferase (adenine-specific)